MGRDYIGELHMKGVNFELNVRLQRGSQMSKISTLKRLAHKSRLLSTELLATLTGKGGKGAEGDGRLHLHRHHRPATPQPSLTATTTSTTITEVQPPLVLSIVMVVMVAAGQS